MGISTALHHVPARPVVLFARSPAEHARVTGMPRGTLYRQSVASRAQGIVRLFVPPPPANLIANPRFGVATRPR